LPARQTIAVFVYTFFNTKGEAELTLRRAAEGVARLVAGY
jgi:hypothetical protein